MCWLHLSWPEHSQHSLARRWFAANSARGWATCPIVQAGFVRVVSNPSFSAKSITPQEAIEALRISLQDGAHQFWPDSLSLQDSMQVLKTKVTGHQQITDAYLVALAIHNRGKLATLDQGIVQLGGAGAVELIS